MYGLTVLAKNTLTQQDNLGFEPICPVQFARSHSSTLRANYFRKSLRARCKVSITPMVAAGVKRKKGGGASCADRGKRWANTQCLSVVQLACPARCQRQSDGSLYSTCLDEVSAIPFCCKRKCFVSGEATPRRQSIERGEINVTQWSGCWGSAIPPTSRDCMASKLLQETSRTGRLTWRC